MTTIPPPDPTPTFAEALFRLARSNTARFFIILFLGAELISGGLFPAVIQTVDTWTTQSKATTQESLAIYAQRIQKAEARKQAGEARHKEELAKNSQVVLAAKTTVAQQEAAINEEKAKYEKRRGAAEARLNAANARLQAIEAKIKTAETETAEIKEFQEALNACHVAISQRAYANNGLGGLMSTTTAGVTRQCLRWHDEPKR